MWRTGERAAGEVIERGEPLIGYRLLTGPRLQSPRVYGERSEPAAIWVGLVFLESLKG